MMKTEQLIVQYLYSNRKVTLQDIGTFSVSGDLNFSSENDKDLVLPPDSILFQYDQRAQADEGLISYIMEHTRKIRPLAASDLESYIMLNKQFLNIGKPLIMEGLGTLQKTQAGEYAFTQAGITHLTHEDLPKAITEKQKEEISFATPQREKSSGGGKAAVWILLLVLIAGGAIAAWYFIHHQKEAPAENEVLTVAVDTAKKPAIDSAAMKKTADSLAATSKPAVKDSNSFYVVIKDFTDHEAAQKSYDRLISYRNKVVLTMKDSSQYSVRMPFMKPLTDTLRVKDSLSKFFATKARIELP